MIVTILKSSKSSLGAIRYNERKCSAMTAELVATANIGGISEFKIVNAFSQLEKNPFIDSRTKNCSFHLAINPGTNDGFQDESIEAFVKEIMEFMGFGSQPYVIYRHHDIERQHYHVVSTRLLPQGSLINNSFDRNRLLEFTKSLEKKYDFIIGCGDAFESRIRLERQVEHYSDSINKADSIAKIFAELTRYPIDSIEEAQMVLESFHIEAKRNKVRNYKPEFGGSGYVITLRGTEQVKGTGRKWYNAEKDLNIQADKIISETINRNRQGNTMQRVDIDRLIRDMTFVKYSFEKFKDRDESLAVMQAYGVYLVCKRDEANKRNRYFIVDQIAKTIYNERDMAEAEDIVKLDKIVQKYDFSKIPELKAEKILKPEEIQKLKAAIRDNTIEYSHKLSKGYSLTLF